MNSKSTRVGLADELKQALATYTASGGHGETTIDTAQAVAALLEKHEICCDMLHGFDWSAWTGPDAGNKLALLPPAQEHILNADRAEGKDRTLETLHTDLVGKLYKSFDPQAAE